VTTKDITLIGAGLAGSLLAVLLAHRGYKVTVYERRPDMRKVDISAGRSINLALANRGIAALERAGLIDRVNPLLIPMAGRMLHPIVGELGFQPYGKTENEVIYSVSRGDLNRILMDAAEEAGVSIQFDTPCDGYDFERSVLHVGGKEIPCPTVIATDGAGSPIRRSMVHDHDIQVSESILAHGYKELTMPPLKEGGHAMEKSALHIWPRGGYMLIALPNLDGSFTVTLFLPMSDGVEYTFENLSDEAAAQAFFERQFPDAVRLLPNLAEQFFNHPTGRMVTIRSMPWHIGSQTMLLGDAAHAIVPFHGQGMNCAFEDCAALDKALLRRPDDEWDSIFAAVERARKPNAEAIADMALENYIEMRDLVAQPRFQLQKQLEFLLEERHPGRFIRRYAMVMFHSMPYAEAHARGQVQQALLDELTEGINDLANIDLARADELVEALCNW